MGEKMTLEQVRDWHLKRVEFFSHGGMPWGAMAHESQQCADAITAHLTQPAQAVDAGKALAHALEVCDVPQAYRYAIADHFTRALGNAQAEGWKEAALDALRGLKCPHDGKNGDVYEKAAAHVWGDAIIAAMRAVHTLPTPPQPEE